VLEVLGLNGRLIPSCGLVWPAFAAFASLAEAAGVMLQRSVLIQLKQ
jgi:hypothetical protein